MGIDNWIQLSPLKKAVKKIRFLLNFNIVNKWRIASLIGASSSRNLRQFSFNDRPGLRGIDDDTNKNSFDSPGSSDGRQLQRAMSYLSTSDDDVDKRAEMFIANFYNQLRIERQISLELQYCRGNSFDSSKSP